MNTFTIHGVIVTEKMTDAKVVELLSEIFESYAFSHLGCTVEGSSLAGARMRRFVARERMRMGKVD